MSNRPSLAFVNLAVSSIFVITTAVTGCGGGSGGANGTTAGATGTAGPTNSTGGTPGTGGATGTVGVLGSWAEWPMPNAQVDVAAGAPNLESYTDNGDGTVSDNISGLMWQQTPPPTQYIWADAVAYCRTLTLAGHSDWRLPSRIELVSLVDVGEYPSINGTYFPATPEGYYFWYWSSSLLADGSTSFAWYVNFDDGHTNYALLVETHMYNLRCVRSPSAEASAPAGRYVTMSGTVYDIETKLTWQQTASSPEYTWADANTYCAGVSASLGGTGWRLPTFKELQTIVDDSRLNPSIDPTAFPTIPAGFTWASSREVYVGFDKGASGSAGGYADAVLGNVRCVR
jgi:hypothetical protein